jgi:hypothetical protein
MQWLLIHLLYLAGWLWQFDLNRIELSLCAAGCALAALGWRAGAFPILRSLASRPLVSVLCMGMAALALRAALLTVLPIPSPVISDEFSHLLLADTLASGRLANPTHPMWRHFETIHVIQRPQYASMYFPAQGAFLAFGKVVLGHPWYGVWLSTGLMCASLCWMLQQWLPLPWALFGGAIAVLRFAAFSYWNDSYWGGSVPALGGALVLGAVARIAKRPSAGNGLVFGVGAILLLYSRPYEGFALCAAGGLFCRKQWLSKASFAVILLVITGCAGLSYYCYRVTGSAIRLPYQVNQETYGWPMTLLIAAPHPNLAQPQQLRQYYNWELAEHNKFLPDSVIEKGQFLWGFFIGPCLTIPLFFLRNDRRIRPLIFIGGAVLAAVLLEQTGYPHYFSPATGVLLALVVQGTRHLRQTRLGATFGTLIPAILGLTLVVRIAAAPMGLEMKTLAGRLSWCCQLQENTARTDLENKLSGLPGLHLVIVHYGPKHRFWREWVYNRADIDSAKVVWARDSGAGNAELERYFSGRHVWNVVDDD